MDVLFKSSVHKINYASHMYTNFRPILCLQRMGVNIVLTYDKRVVHSQLKKSKQDIFAEHDFGPQ